MYASIDDSLTDVGLVLDILFLDMSEEYNREKILAVVVKISKIEPNYRVTRALRDRLGGSLILAAEFDGDVRVNHLMDVQRIFGKQTMGLYFGVKVVTPPPRYLRPLPVEGSLSGQFQH